ncbi:MAG: TIGR00730 family Rossman fold protein [Verrucomicrobiota bacterium]
MPKKASKRTPKRSNKKKPYSTGSSKADKQIDQLLDDWKITGDRNYFREMLTTIYKFAEDKPCPADIRLFTKTMKELRYADSIFAEYRGIRKVSVYGSARIQPGLPEYEQAQTFAKTMVRSGYMVITGGGEGIMGAAQAGAGRKRSFALNISLPFEQSANATIEGDSKLINFKYFFTRKVNFVKNSDAFVLCPGGFGTMDEGFETITLMQTGKSPIVPIVLLDAPRGNYWTTFARYLREHLLGDGLVSEMDFNLFTVTDDPEVARKEIVRFYYNYHSSRFVKDTLVLRMQREVPQGALFRLQEDFADILTTPKGMVVSRALPDEINEPELAKLPRLCLQFDRRSYGRLRLLIDRINQF